jgi:carboxymethylenebutenolidase
MRRAGLIAILALVLTASCNRTEPEHAGHDPATGTTPPAATGSNPAPAAPQASGANQPVTYGEASGFLAVPSGGPSGGDARKAALIVIQEWWGVDDWIKEQNARFASKGYVALAPDLYRGRKATSPEEAHELMRGMPEDRALADLEAAVDYLAARPDVDPNRIGVIGWCMGGGYALKLAAADPRVKATVVNYGSVLTDTAAITRINSQILGNFGGADRGIPAGDVKTFGANLTKYGKLGDIKIYDGAGHAFMNPHNKQGYDAAAAEDAWGRIDRFFERLLRPAAAMN